MCNVHIALWEEEKKGTYAHVQPLMISQSGRKGKAYQ